MTTLTAALLEVHGILDEEGVPHALCGGIAANLYRDEVRATMDVDFAIVVGPARVVELVRTFEDAGWHAEAYWERGEQLRLDHAQLPRVDCIVATTDYEHAAIKRATIARIEGRDVPVLTAEDLIVFKLVAGRARDFEAVAAMINTLGDALDVAYVKEWLEQLGFPDAWTRAEQEAVRETGR